MTEPLLTDLIKAYGDKWTIKRSTSPPCWIAVSRPSPTAQHVIAATSLAELAGKLGEAEEG